MKQILQDMAKGGTTVTEAPVPQCSKGHLLISTATSLISAGTERMLVGFGKASMILPFMPLSLPDNTTTVSPFLTCNLFCDNLGHLLT